MLCVWTDFYIAKESSTVLPVDSTHPCYCTVIRELIGLVSTSINDETFHKRSCWIWFTKFINLEMEETACSEKQNY